MIPPSRAEQPPLLAIALISAAALAYEILLIRLFSITQWHHFAYMMISLALLGYGASGTFLALTRRIWQGRYQPVFILNAIAFAVTAVACFLIAQALPFNALEVVWDPRQQVWLLATYLLLFVPFFCAVNCICLSFIAYRDQVHRVYGADLLGAALGAMGIIGLLFVLMPLPVLGLVAALGWATALAGSLALRWRRRMMAILAPLGAVLTLLPTLLVEPRLSEYKGFSQALAVSGARIEDRRSSPLGLLTTVASPDIPFRHAPGLSLATPLEPSEQLAMFTDGDSMSVITRFDGDLEPLAYLQDTGSALAYRLLEAPVVLVLGAGGGSSVLQALGAGASAIHAVELNSQYVELLAETFVDFSGGIYRHPKVHVYRSEARGFLAARDDRYDLLQIDLLDSFAASSAGLHALSESYLYTVEALEEMLEHLRPGGFLSITRWLRLPPRDGLKLMLTAADALARRGAEDPGAHLLLLRSWNTSTLLVAERPYTQEQLAEVRAFADQRWFDLAWYPGMERVEANRYNRWREPWMHDGAVALLGEGRKEFLAAYKFELRPASDDRPYFFHFTKWRTLPELFRLRGQGGLPLLEQGYLLLLATLAQATLAGLVIVLLPLLLFRGSSERIGGTRLGRARVLAYFLAVGFGFMLIEIAFIQKFILFLSHPLYAVAVVLATFLLFAGLGSALSRRWLDRPLMAWSVAGIAGLSLAYLWGLGTLFEALMAWPDVARIAVAIALIAPLALLMGMPFPLGLDRLAASMPAWIPWAWAINGCASVVAAILATLLAIHLGFSVVIGLALCCYLAAALAMSEMARLPGAEATGKDRRGGRACRQV